jgi:hypothetical protein
MYWETLVLRVEFRFFVSCQLMGYFAYIIIIIIIINVLAEKS